VEAAQLCCDAHFVLFFVCFFPQLPRRLSWILKGLLSCFLYCVIVFFFNFLSALSAFVFFVRLMCVCVLPSIRPHFFFKHGALFFSLFFVFLSTSLVVSPFVRYAVTFAVLLSVLFFNASFFFLFVYKVLFSPFFTTLKRSFFFSLLEPAALCFATFFRAATLLCVWP
jgi:hypothetical protein